MLIARLGLLAGLTVIAGCSGTDLSKAAPVKSLSAAELCADLAPRLEDGRLVSHPLFDKVVEVRGEVAAVFPLHSSAEIHLDSENATIHFVTCFFSTHAAQAKPVRVGERVTIRGKCGAVLGDDRKRWVCLFDSLVVK